MPEKTETTLTSPNIVSSSGKKYSSALEFITQPLAYFSFPVLLAALLWVAKFFHPGFEDPDFYWHLKTGEHIALTSSIPMTDPFSWTFLGQPWVAHEWLTEWLFHLAYQLGGFDGISVLVATASALTFGQLYQTATKYSGNNLRGNIIATACLALMLPFLTPRPQVFTFLLFTLYLRVLFEFKYENSTRSLWILPFAMVAWVNLHGAFMIGAGLLSFFLVIEWIKWFSEQPADPEKKRRLMMLGIAAALTFAATLVNPQGLRILLFPFELISMEASKSVIAEWQSPDFHSTLAKLYLAAILAMIGILIYSRRRPDLTELGAIFLMLAAGLSSTRHLPLMSLAFAAFSSVFISDFDKSSLVPAWISGKAFRRSPPTSEVSAKAAGLIHLAALLATIAVFQTGVIPTASRPVLNEHVPTGAAEYLEKNGIQGRMFNSYGLGGYLVFRLSPRQKVFIDGRADLFGDKFVLESVQIEGGREGWKEKFERHDIEFAVVYRKSPLRQLLLETGEFSETYLDTHHAVLLRKLPRFQALIRAAKDSPVASRNGD